MTDEAAVRAVLEEYVAACMAGSVERLQAIFHPEALMTGYLAGNYLMGSVEPFYDAVRNSAAPGADYHAEIGPVEVAGAVASAGVRERGYLGLDFTDFFHLARVHDRWLIVSKTFNSSVR